MLESKAEYMRRWRAANKDKIHAATIAWQKRNPEKVKIYAKRSYEKNKASRIERVGAYQRSERGKMVHSKANARYNLAQRMGLSGCDVPPDLVDAYVALFSVQRMIAQGMEAEGRDEGTVHDSPVAESDAP